MNPNNPAPTNFELPAPEAGTTSSTPEMPASLEAAPNPSQQMPAQQQIDQQLSDLQQAPIPQAQTPAAAPTTNAPGAADDADLIEKEWVEKAKSIVASTRSDPRTQSRELNKFKADYMQKRYNKTIKVDES